MLRIFVIPEVSDRESMLFKDMVLRLKHLEDDGLSAISLYYSQSLKRSCRLAKVNLFTFCSGWAN